jgi:hypothetical protein
MAYLLRLWWPRFVGAFAALALVAGAFWLALPGKKPNDTTLLARNESSSRSTLPGSVSPAENDKLSSTALPKVSQDDQRFLAAQKVKREELLDDLKRDTAAKDIGVSTGSPLAENKPPNSQSVAITDREQLANVAMSAPPGTPATATALALENRINRGLGQATAAPEAVARSAGQEKKQELEKLASQISAPQNQESTPLGLVQPAAPAPAQVANSSVEPLVQYGYFAGTQVYRQQQGSLARRDKAAAFDESEKSLNSSGPALAQVLRNFRVEQSGPELHVIDNDGSVYTGQVRLTTALAGGAGVMQQPNAAVQTVRTAAAQTQSAQSAGLVSVQQENATPSYAFQVVGTNRTLKQRIIFSGVLSGITNGNFQSNAAVTPTIGAELSQPVGGKARLWNTRQNWMNSNLRVSGTALIGPNEQFQIEAVPAAQQAPNR